ARDRGGARDRRRYARSAARAIRAPHRARRRRKHRRRRAHRRHEGSMRRNVLKTAIRIVLGLATIIGLGGVGWAAAARGAPGKSATSASAATTSSALVAPALVEPEGDVLSLAFDTGGRVVDVRVREGDRVEAGALLAN